MKRFLFSLLLAALFVSAASAQSTIFIVRHADKAEDGGKDPDLSEAGRAHAEALAKTLRDSGITTFSQRSSSGPNKRQRHWLATGGSK